MLISRRLLSGNKNRGFNTKTSDVFKSARSPGNATIFDACTNPGFNLMATIYGQIDELIKRNSE